MAPHVGQILSAELSAAQPGRPPPIVMVTLDCTRIGLRNLMGENYIVLMARPAEALLIAW